MTKVVSKKFIGILQSNNSDFLLEPYFDRKQKNLPKESSPIKVESFLISIFDLNQTYQIVLTEGCWI